MLLKSFQLFLLLLCIGSSLSAALNSINITSSVAGKKWFRNDYTYNDQANGWFKVHPVPVNWQRARLICHYEGAELVSPLSSGVLEGIKDILSSTEPKQDSYFSGVHQIFGDGVYTSIGGVPLEKLHVEWFPNEPHNKDRKEQCLEVFRDGKFNDANCDSYLPYICFRKYSLADELTSCGTVDSGYALRNDLEKRFGISTDSMDTNLWSSKYSEADLPELQRCYKLHKHAHTWELAHIICQAEGGYLAIINSYKEAQVLERLINSNATYGGLFAVGFREWESDGDWWTVHGQTLKDAGFESWASGQPDSLEIQSRRKSCGGYKRGELVNIWCDVPFGFICEKTVLSINDASEVTQQELIRSDT